MTIFDKTIQDKKTRNYFNKSHKYFQSLSAICTNLSQEIDLPKVTEALRLFHCFLHCSQRLRKLSANIPFLYSENLERELINIQFALVFRDQFLQIIFNVNNLIKKGLKPNNPMSLF